MHNVDNLITASNHRTFRSGAIYRAINCAATVCALGNCSFYDITARAIIASSGYK